MTVSPTKINVARVPSSDKGKASSGVTEGKGNPRVKDCKGTAAHEKLDRPPQVWEKTQQIDSFSRPRRFIESFRGKKLVREAEMKQLKQLKQWIFATGELSAEELCIVFKVLRERDEETLIKIIKENISGKVVGWVFDLHWMDGDLTDLTDLKPLITAHLKAEAADILEHIWTYGGSKAGWECVEKGVEGSGTLWEVALKHVDFSDAISWSMKWKEGDQWEERYTEEELIQAIDQCNNPRMLDVVGLMELCSFQPAIKSALIKQLKKAPMIDLLKYDYFGYMCIGRKMLLVYCEVIRRLKIQYENQGELSKEDLGMLVYAMSRMMNRWRDIDSTEFPEAEAYKSVSTTWPYNGKKTELHDSIVEMANASPINTIFVYMIASHPDQLTRVDIENLDKDEFRYLLRAMMLVRTKKSCIGHKKDMTRVKEKLQKWAEELSREELRSEVSYWSRVIEHIESEVSYSALEACRTGLL